MTQVRVPLGVPMTRYRPQAVVDVPGNTGVIPLIRPDDAPERKIQQVWKARIRIFDLSNPEDFAACEDVYQRVIDRFARICEAITKFDEKTGHFYTYMRWIDISHCIPNGI